jgi:hypothetical protein
MLAGREARRRGQLGLTLTDSCRHLPESALYRSRHRPRDSELLIQVERGLFRRASPLLRRGYGFFPSPNHLRIFAIRLAIPQLYDHPGRFAKQWGSRPGVRGTDLRETVPVSAVSSSHACFES